MTYVRQTSFGGGVFFAPSLAALDLEIADCCGLTAWDGTRFDVVSLGRYPSPEHQRASPNSRHNPMLTPQGDRLVCAEDIGDAPGAAGSYRKVAMFTALKYAAGDERLAPNGFVQLGDGNSLTWQDRFPTSVKWHWTGGDRGHNHNDTNMRDRSFDAGPSSYVPAMRSTAPWGFRTFITTGQLEAADVANAFDGLDPTVGSNIYVAAGRIDERTAFLQARLAGITNGRPAEQLATAADLARLVMFTVDDRPEVWALVGLGRAWVSPIAYAHRRATGSAPPVELTSADPWAHLPVVGDGPQLVRYVQFSDAQTELERAVIWRVVDGVRDALSYNQWIALGKPTPEQVTLDGSAAETVSLGAAL